MKIAWTVDEYIRALHFAAKAHSGQEVPGSGLPFIVHLSSVSLEVITAVMAEPENDGDLMVKCALLHDVLEDTKVSYDQIKSEFGVRVAEGVRALTKSQEVEKSLQMAECLARIQKQPQEIWMVKLADRIVNLQPPPSYWTSERRKQYLEQSIEINEALKIASRFLSTRLLCKIEDYKQYCS